MAMLAESKSPDDINRAIKSQHKAFAHLLVIVFNETYFLYGSKESDHAAEVEAKADHPLGEIAGRVEYLSPEKLAEIKAMQRKDPVAEAMRSLGRTT